jgi:hypothetical protein
MNAKVFQWRYDADEAKSFAEAAMAQTEVLCATSKRLMWELSLVVAGTQEICAVSTNLIGGIPVDRRTVPK